MDGLSYDGSVLNQEQPVNSFPNRTVFNRAMQHGYLRRLLNHQITREDKDKRERLLQGSAVSSLALHFLRRGKRSYFFVL